MSLQLVVGGHYLSALTAWGDLDWSLCWPGYSDELTFDVASHPSVFKPGAMTSLVWMGERLWSGTLDEPVRGQKLRAAGLHRVGEKYAALDGSLNLSLTPNTVIDAAIGRGLPWIRTASWNLYGDPPLSTDSVSNVTQVIDGNTALHPPTWDWGVLPSGVMDRCERTTPRLHVRPGGDGLGIAWDNYASTLIARYVDSTTHNYTTAIVTDAVAGARWGYKEVTLSKPLNDGAEMSNADAISILESMLAKGRSRPGWTSPIEVEFGGILGNNQQAIDLRAIRPYEQVRVHGLDEDVADLAGRTWVDMPIARIQHTASKPQSVVLTPVGLVSPMLDVLSGKSAD